ncbi:hypothetical protein OKW44_000406 [Paraburkholderia sp. WSM4174]
MTMKGKGKPHAAFPSPFALPLLLLNRSTQCIQAAPLKAAPLKGSYHAKFLK